MDDDDTLDVVAAGFSARAVVWYENNLPTWIKHTIDDNSPAAGFLIATDFDHDGDLDVFASGNRSIVYYDNKPGVAYAKSMQSHPGFIPQEGEALVINAQLYNPESHPVTVHAIIRGEQHAFTDSIQLYDDGLHSDSIALDNIWGNGKWMSGLPADIYTMEISSYDIVEDFSYSLSLTPSFTTIGPVEYVESFDHRLIGMAVNRFKFKIRLQNLGQEATAANIGARLKLLSEDSCFTMSDNLYRYGDIAPGEIVNGTQEYTVWVDTSCLKGQSKLISFIMQIESDGTMF